MEPTYTTIEEAITTTTGGSEAIISDILSTRDPRELTLLEAGERGPAPLEMRASLPAGSFSPFDFEKEFQTRHGVRLKMWTSLNEHPIYQENQRCPLYP